MCAALAPAMAAAATSRDVETKGILTSAESGQISPNVWDGLNRADALFLIEALPTRFVSPVYYELARRLLLSDAPALPQATDTKAVAAIDANRPDILIARLDKLLAMGALRDAETLYDTVVPDIADNFDLARRSLMILMLRGQFSAACLDVQAMQGAFSQVPAWQDYNKLCSIQFAPAADRGRLLASANFEVFKQIPDLMRTYPTADLARLSVQDLAFAVAMGALSPARVQALAPQAGRLSPLLLTVLYQYRAEEAQPERICLGIEATRRGIIQVNELIKLYELPRFDSAILLNNVGTAPDMTSLHACHIAPLLYQRIASSKDPLVRDQAIRASFDIMKGMPDAAFWPMTKYIKDFDVKAVLNQPYVWRAATIYAYVNDELPAAWQSGWGGPQGKGVSPFWPVQAAMNRQADSLEDANLWRTQWPSQAQRIAEQDPILPYLLGKTIDPKSHKSADKTKNKIVNYDNNISLTFSRSYAIPSYGLTQRLKDVIEKRQAGQSVSLIVIGYGTIPADQIVPDQMVKITEGFSQFAMDRFARQLALEILRN